MAITIDWATSIINIPRNDMTLIQSSPNEIRELDLNFFRLSLKALEADYFGMPHPKTHEHNAPFDVGTVELARGIRILEPYTITFEDGQYAVNLSGANTNLADRANVNQVSIRPNNSAGLATSTAIEFGEYDGAVTLDISNSTGNAGSGTIYPRGTLRAPVDNIPDGLLIAEARGFRRLVLLGDATFTVGHNVDSFVVAGTSHIQNVVTLQDAASCQNTVFTDIEVQGILDGNNEITFCVVRNLTYFSGHIHDSGLAGTIILSGNTSSVIAGCRTIDPFSPPVIDMNVSGNDLAMPNYSGLLTIQNLNSATNFAGVGLLGGTITVDLTTVLQGTIQCAGVGYLQDHLGNRLDTGTYGNVSVINQTVTEDSMVHRIWNETNGSAYPATSFGRLLHDLSKVSTNNVSRSGDTITIYEDDGVTVWRQYDLTGGGRDLV